MEITVEDLCWLAGLLEGEGSFMMGRNTVRGKVYLYPKIVVTMTDLDVIQRAANLFGTSVYNVPRDKKAPEGRLPQYRAQISGTNAANLMKDLFPKMGSRRSAKIEEILLAYSDDGLSVNEKRAASCAKTAKARWDKYGSRSGRL